MFESNDDGMAATATATEPYAYAWDRVREALDHGFYLESITICESVICDCLSAFVKSQGVKLNRPYNGLAHLVRKARCTDAPTKVQTEQEPTLTDAGSSGVLGSDNLLSDLDAWRWTRNALLNGVANAVPDFEFETEGEYVDQAMRVAQEGEKLARLVVHWCSQARSACA